VHDDASYVPREMLSAWAERDPVQRYGRWLAENAAFSEDEDADLRSEVKALLGDALRRAEASPLPDPASVADRVYAESVPSIDESTVRLSERTSRLAGPTGVRLPP
jgi:TPP-dependent pyruvate/acetoin dehydrogenase alpha subunit